jgi:hypothetical protein
MNTTLVIGCSETVSAHGEASADSKIIDIFGSARLGTVAALYR